MTDTQKTEPLDLETGLYWDESSRTLEEVTRDLFTYLVDEVHRFDASEDDWRIYGTFTPDSSSGLIRTEEDPDIWQDLYSDLADCMTDNLPDGLYFAYVNEFGAWGVWNSDWEDWS